MVNADRTLPNGRTLNDVMEFDHVILVRQDGTVSDGPIGVHAPEVYENGGQAWIEPAETGWTLMDGYSGQQGYSGPVMHSSESIGGRMADDILSTPGLYVAVVVSDLDCDESCQDVNSGHGEGDPDHEPVGWTVARRDIPHADYPHHPGRLYDCSACESQCFCGDNCPTCQQYDETDTCSERHEQCVYCAS